MKGYLVLENGSVFRGERIGANKDAICEVVRCFDDDNIFV